VEGGREECREGMHVRTFHEGQEFALHPLAFIAAAAPASGGGGGGGVGRRATELVDFVDEDDA